MSQEINSTRVTVERHTLPNGKFRYTVNGETHLKQSVRKYETAQVYYFDGEVIIQMGKGGSNRYIEHCWSHEVDVIAVAIWEG